jgi:uncharacterized protein (TIGR02391 family)
VTCVPAYFDNVVILQAIDRLQQERGGQALLESAHDILQQVAGTYVIDDVMAAGFLQEMITAGAAGLVTWRLMDQTAQTARPSYALQQMRQLALTAAGQDRARNRMTELPPLDPGEDDGHQLSDLILRQVAGGIIYQLDPVQAAILLAEEGLPPPWLGEVLGEDAPDPAIPGGVHNTLVLTWHAGSEGRRVVRRFLGRWLDQQLFTGPDADEQADLLGKLARQGWQLRESDSVLVATDPVRGMPVPAAPMHSWHPHPLVEAVARPQFGIKQSDQAVFTSLKEVEIRVRKLGGFPDDVIGVDLMNRAFGPGGSLTDTAAPKGEQEGTRALFVGAMAVLRNPSGHRQVDLAPAEAVEAVAVASLLMRILDRVEDRVLADARAVQPSSGS